MLKILFASTLCALLLFTPQSRSQDKRAAELKAEIAKTEAHLASLKAELASLPDKPKVIDITDLLKDDRMRQEQDSKGDFKEYRMQRALAERQALLRSVLKGEGKVHDIITVNSGRNISVKVIIEVEAGGPTRRITTIASDPFDPPLRNLNKGDKIKFQGTLTSFSPDSLNLVRTEYGLVK